MGGSSGSSICYYWSLNDHGKEGEPSFFYIMEDKKSLIKILILYYIFLTVGYIYGVSILETNEQKIDKNALENFNELEAFIKIGIKNIIAFLIILSGIFLSKKIVYFFFIVNGYVLGVFISKLTKIQDIIVILPHGVLEMTSYILTGYFCIRFIDTDNSKYIKKIFFCFLLMLIAVIIESILTPILIETLL